MEKTLQISRLHGYVAMINIPVWMFLSTYEKMRNTIIANNTITTMLHFGRGIFGSDFGTTAFSIQKEESSSIKEATGDYLRSRVPLIPWKRKSGGSLKEKAPIFQLKTAFPIFPEILLHIG